MGDAQVSTEPAADGSFLVHIRGEVDIGCADAVCQVLVNAAARRPSRVVVDVRDMTFIDSIGVLALVAGRKAAIGAGAGFTLREPRPFVVKLLRQTGLYDTLVTGE